MEFLTFVDNEVKIFGFLFQPFLLAQKAIMFQNVSEKVQNFFLRDNEYWIAY
eukprot:UN00309